MPALRPVKGLPRAVLFLVVNTWFSRPTDGVLRYPDGSFESRSPLHVDECGALGSDISQGCLLQLRQHLLEDADCNRIICDNIDTSTPMEVYANQSDWAPFKNLCGHLQEMFLNIFDLGLELLSRAATQDDQETLVQHWQTFARAWAEWLGAPDEIGAPAFANTTRSVLRRHAEVVAEETATGLAAAVSAIELLNLAVVAARRLQLMIENVSVTLLLNYLLANLEYNSRVDGRDFIGELYGDSRQVRVIFHEIPGKRWDSLSHLLERLGVSERPIAMAEIGVEAANTSQRLLERNPALTYIGIDPYRGNDGLYLHVMDRLEAYRATGRFTLHRSQSLDAANEVSDGSLDLVFLDARHDFQAVWEDISAWRGKVREGGVISGHDFSWMFPTVAMATYKAAFTMPDQTIHLAPDGVWWFHL